MNTGDWRQWLTRELYAQVEDVVNQKSDYPVPYYIQVQLNPEYQGPSVASEQTREETFTAKAVYVIRLVLMNRPPAIPQLGTLLFYDNNASGDLRLEYALPADKPNAVEDSDNYGTVVEQVAKMSVPVIYN